MKMAQGRSRGGYNIYVLYIYIYMYLYILFIYIVLQRFLRSYFEEPMAA